MEDYRRMIAVPLPAPTEERELTPSPGLRELTTPDLLNESRLTPSPAMISPDMYLPLPKPPEDINIYGIDLSSLDPAIFIPFTINTDSKEKYQDSNYNANNNLQLLANTCDKNMQMCMTDKNIASSMAKEADSFNLKRESGALGFHTAITSVSPEFGVGATNYTKHHNYKKINSFKCKPKTKSTRLKNKYVKAKHQYANSTTESSDNNDLGGQEMISESRPEPIQPPEKIRPARMKLLPTISKQEVSESEISSQLTDISEGSPVPINLRRRNRSPRIKQLPSEEQKRARVGLLPMIKSLGEKKFFPSLSSPINKRSRRRDSNSLSFPSTSARAQALPSVLAQPSSSGSRAGIPVTVPRTRILVTPERFKRVHTPVRKPKKGTFKKYLRYAAKKRKWVESARRHPERFRSDLSTTDTNEDSSDSGNTGDCSGLGEDDANENDHKIDSGEDKKGSSGGKGGNTKNCEKCASCSCHGLGGRGMIP